MQRLLIPLFLAFFCFSCKEEPSRKIAKKQKPNILFIMADDHAMQAISAYNYPISQLAPTPNIDRIAKNGALFRHAFVTNSICGPSRAVILTGKYSHINGFRQNGDSFDGSQATLPKMLKKAGYQTALTGKWHLNAYPEGFDYWNILVDQGQYYNPDFINQKGDTVRIEGYATDIITDDALHWLKNSRKDSLPFFMMVHHKAPHRNWMPPLRYLTKYDSVQFPLPDTYFPNFKNQKASKGQLQTIYKDMYEGHDLKISKSFGSTELAANPWTTDFNRMNPDQRKQWDDAYLQKNNTFWKADLHGRALDEYKGQRYLRDYMATVAAVDDGVGKILDYLEKNELDENTLVIYTSDQGFWMGEKGWFDKRFMYEESFGTPLMMQLPGTIPAKSKIDAMVMNLDFAQTFLDFADVSEMGHKMQGKSFKGLLDGSLKTADFRDVVYYHYYDYPAFHMVKKHYGIRTERYKLMHFYDDIDTWEFYDLASDPQELTNSIQDSAYTEVIKMLHHKLDSVQKVYKVTDKEFEKAPKEKVEKAYNVFNRLRGTPIQ